MTNPHLLDWNRDGHTDLVVGYTEGGWHDTQWTLYVGAGPLAGKTEVEIKPFALPKVPDANAVYFGFTDRHLDLLAAVRYQKGSDDARRTQQANHEPISYGIYWFRNTTKKGEPRFAAASPLLTIPAPWELDGFAVVDQGHDGPRELVVSVSKNIRHNPKHGYFDVDSQLWLYRRKQ